MRRRTKEVKAVLKRVATPRLRAQDWQGRAPVTVKRKAVKRSLSPVAASVVYVRKSGVNPDTHAKGNWVIPGRHGLEWEYMGVGLEREARYDPQGMDLVRKLRGNKVPLSGIKGLIERMCPMLNPERKKILEQRIHAIAHAKQRKEEAEASKASGFNVADPVYRSRRLTRKEKGKKKDARSRLKELLRK